MKNKPMPSTPPFYIDWMLTLICLALSAFGSIARNMDFDHVAILLDKQGQKPLMMVLAYLLTHKEINYLLSKLA